MTNPTTAEKVPFHHGMAKKLHNAANSIMDQAPSDLQEKLLEGATCIERLWQIKQALEKHATDLTAELASLQRERDGWKERSENNERVRCEVMAHANDAMARTREVERERDGLRDALAHIAANSYDHHTPYMVCIPVDEWKIAEAMLDDTARGAGNG